MKFKTRITQIVSAGLLVLAIGLACLGYITVRGDVQKLKAASNEDILWHAFQLELEFQRFKFALHHHGEERDMTSALKMENRFDILWSRVIIFERASVGNRLSAYDTTHAVDHLFETMKKYELAVLSARNLQGLDVEELSLYFEPHADDLRQLTHRISYGEIVVRAQLRDNLLEGQFILTILGMAAVLTSALFALFFARESRYFRRLAKQNAKLLVVSKDANAMKAQFLSMISHELRTPMNGVLGPLALLKQNGLNEGQMRLVDQMGRSGQQMNALLRDVLDFADLQEGTFVFKSQPFDAKMLAASIEVYLASEIQQSETDFEIIVGPEVPALLSGDFARLRLIFTHLASYVLSTAGTKIVRLTLGHDGQSLVGKLHFAYNSDGGRWYPELITGKLDRGQKNIASAALGPAIARGIIEKMGGTLKLDSPDHDQIALLIELPAAPLIVRKLLVHVETHSRALGAICMAAMRDEKVEFWDETCEDSPHVIMVEAGALDEMEAVSKLRRNTPNAMIIAIGSPQNPDLFEDVVDLPIDINKLQDADFMRLAG